MLFITRLLDYAKSVLTDESTNTPAFGKVVSVPFLVSAWAIGTVYGGQLLHKGKDPDDLIWSMAGIAIFLYGAYKTGNVIIHRTKTGKSEVTPPTPLAPPPKPPEDGDLPPS